MSSDRLFRGLLAAPALGDRGGGVGQVSEMLWQSLRDTWDSDATVVTLLRDGRERPDALDKLRFGATIAARQVFKRPDWMLFSHLGLARAGRLIPSSVQTPFAVFLHGIECWTGLGDSDLMLLNRAALRIANSEFTARRAREMNPGLRDIAVCPLALPGELPPPHNHPRVDPIVLVVGRLSASERYKGHDELIEAWPHVAARVSGARLVIVGDGDDLPRLRQLARDKGVDDRVEFHGFVTREALAAEYRRAAVFALPSRGEGFGLVYLEAMAHGLPCVGSRHDAASEVIVDRATGTLVDPGNGREVIRALCDLLQQPERRRALGQAGRERVVEQFTYQRFRADIIGLLRDAFDQESVTAVASA